MSSHNCLISKVINLYWRRKTLRNLDQEMRKTLILASALSKNQPLSNTASGRINMRRRTVINELFARNIAEQMSKSELHGFDIQLTRVRKKWLKYFYVTQPFKFLGVCCTGLKNRRSPLDQ